MVAKAGGRIAGQIVIVHTEDGRLLLQIKRVVSTPLMEVADSSGNEYCIALDDYERASVTEQAQFYRAKAEAIQAKVVTWN